MTNRDQGWPRRQMTVVCGLAAVTSLFMGVAVAEGLSTLESGVDSRQASPQLPLDRPPIVVPEMEFPTPTLNAAQPRPKQQTPPPGDSDSDRTERPDPPRLHQVREKMSWRTESGEVPPALPAPDDDDDDCVLIPELGEVSRGWWESLDPLLRERLSAGDDDRVLEDLPGFGHSPDW